MRTLRLRQIGGAVILGGSWLVSCSARPSADRGPLPGPSVGGAPAGVGGGSGGALPPEVELEETFKAPVVSDRFIFAANPASNRVVQIDGESLDVRVLDAGHAPTFLTALPEGKIPRGAAVLNALSHDATLFLLEDGDAEPTSYRVPVHRGANAWTVGGSGEFMIAWSSVGSGGTGDDGHQDITVIEPSQNPISVQLGVGYKPTAVLMAQDERRALVVSDPGLTILELAPQGASEVQSEHPLPSSDVAPRDVTMTPDGRYAIVRVTDSKALTSVDLDSNEMWTLDMPAQVSDLDLTADGRWAVSVIRADHLASSEGMGGAGDGEAGAAGADNTSEPQSIVGILPIPEVFQAPSRARYLEIPDIVGSVVLTNDGRWAILFSNASQSSRVWIVELDSGKMRSVDLRAPLKAVIPSPDGKHAVAVLRPPAGSVKKGAFALLPLDRELPARIEGTDEAVHAVVFSPDGQDALVTTLGLAGSSSAAFMAGFPHLKVDAAALPSPPLSAGMIGPLRKAFVSQRHAEGRLTFFDLDSREVLTLTGYEMGSGVIE